MASKKRYQQPLNECVKCGCWILVKDVSAHSEFCGKPLEDSKVSLLFPGSAIKGYLTEVENVKDYLPPDAAGWTRAHSLLLNPQTMEMLRVKPRDPVKLIIEEKSIIMVVWPCKEVGALKMAPSSRLFHNEALCYLEVIQNIVQCDSLEVSINANRLPLTTHMVQYVETFLSNCYVEADSAIFINYYSTLLEVIPTTSLESKMHDISLNEGEIVSIVLQTSDKLCISIGDLSTTTTADRMEEFNSIGGLHSVKSVLCDHVLNPLKNSGTCSSVFMWGLPGSGKTKILKAFAKALGSKAFYFESISDFGDRLNLVPVGMVVILDLTHLDTEHKDYVTFCQFLKAETAAAVILSVRRSEEVDIGVRVRFPVEVEVEVPNEPERLEILKFLLSSTSAQSYASVLSKKTHGFTAGDLKALLIRAQNTQGASQEEKLENARKKMKPTGIRQIILEIPDVKWDDIGGNEEIKLEIQQAVIWPQIHKESYKHYGFSPPTGILLYGPPGCSKTLIARALANEAKMNFLSVKGPEMFSKWVGDSEKAVRDLFARARQVAPTIIFFDEIDAVGASRGTESSSGVSDRVLTQLLTELDGLEKNSEVILLAATNRPDQLDSALLRPGRLDRAIHVGLPSPSTRHAILTLQMKKMPIAGDVMLETLVAKTEGYSGAELVAVCQHAALVAMRGDLKGKVEWAHFEKALTAIVPRTDQNLIDIYHQFELGCV